jgi:hypothetical protein
VVLDLIVARAALDNDPGLGVPHDGFNPACGFPPCRLPALFECVVFGRLIDSLDGQGRERRQLLEGPFMVPPFQGAKTSRPQAALARQ